VKEIFKIVPVGIIRKESKETEIYIHRKYKDALLGLDGFSHIHVFYWFSKNDISEKRKILRVYPRGDAKNPLQGVFATRSPARPNPIAISTCRLIAVKGNIVLIEEIDAFDGSPVIDIKPCIMNQDLTVRFRVPDWVSNDG
jgi:tRNA-Thr(GGU) m(6)t(6)A37 methyltransferase TsaA